MVDRVSNLESTEIARDSQSHLEFIGNIDPTIVIPDGSSILIVSKDQSYLTHGIHKFPAKFFPELPRYLIRRFSNEGDTVLDPMCGSGTVVLEAVLNSRRGVGIDVDAIARLLTKVKTTPICPSLLGNVVSSLSASIQSIERNGEFDGIIPEFNYRDSWFRPFVLKELAILRSCIDEVPRLHVDTKQGSLDDVRDFLRVILSSIIRDSSNADPNCTRTVLRKKVIKKIAPGDTISRFLTVLSKQVAAMDELWQVYSSSASWDVHLPQSTATHTGLDAESIDLAVTSPPYINAVDYPRTHQLEMYWLDLLDEDGPLSNVKRRYIGTESVYKTDYESLRVTNLETLDPILAEIFEADPRRSYIVYKFFDDMEAQLAETLRVLKPGGRYCIAIGNNLIRGVPVKSHEILAEIATKRTGFRIDRVFFSKIIRHFIRIPRKERMLGEWVIILEKPR